MDRSERILGNTRAIIFDLDDTLVSTRVADERAYSVVKRLLRSEFARDEAQTELIVENFRNELARCPWDPSGNTHPWTWRRNLWEAVISKSCYNTGQFDPTTLQLASYKVTEVFRDARLSALVINSACAKLFCELRTRGIGLGIITNGHAVIQREKLAACGAYNFFMPEHICVGGEELLGGRTEKPHRSIFQHMCERLGVAPANAMFVGDNWTSDIRGSKEANIGKSVYISSISEADNVAVSTSTSIFPTIEDFCVTAHKELTDMDSTGV